MTTLVLNPLTAPRAWPDRAVGDEAKRIGERLRLASEFESSVAWGKRQWDLEAACSEASEQNWDGYGAEPVDYITYRTAKKLLEALPTAPREPEIAIDPDGEVSITWRRASRQVFSVSVAGSGRISYAGIFGLENRHGTEYFIDQIPASIQSGLARLFPTGI